MPTDREFMARALDLAEQGRGRTSPNPMVGCVIVLDGEIVGQGYHAAAGEPHAEIRAIESKRGSIENCTVYITLEPCSHHGRTPPCADRLVEGRPARVVVAMEDPNPKVGGRGIEALRKAGIAVEVGILADEAKKLNEVFTKYITTGRPFVIAKCGMTLDGKIATRSGHSRWVTGDISRKHVHELRDEVDAILVGSRTVMTDDPSLTTRLDRDDTRDPIRVILDAGEYLDADRKVFSVPSKAPTWVAACETRDYPFANEVIQVPRGNGGVDIAALMDELGRREIASLLIEGGGTTLGSAFEAGIVDKAMFFVAPKIAGGRDAVTPVEGEGVETMDAAVALSNMTARPSGEDLLIEAYVKKN